MIKLSRGKVVPKQTTIGAVPKYWVGGRILDRLLGRVPKMSKKEHLADIKDFLENTDKYPEDGYARYATNKRFDRLWAQNDESTIKAAERREKLSGNKNPTRADITKTIDAYGEPNNYDYKKTMIDYAKEDEEIERRRNKRKEKAAKEDNDIANKKAQKRAKIDEIGDLLEPYEGAQHFENGRIRLKSKDGTIHDFKNIGEFERFHKARTKAKSKENSGESDSKSSSTKSVTSKSNSYSAEVKANQAKGMSLDAADDAAFDKFAGLNKKNTTKETISSGEKLTKAAPYLGAAGKLIAGLGSGAANSWLAKQKGKALDPSKYSNAEFNRAMADLNAGRYNVDPQLAKIRDQAAISNMMLQSSGANHAGFIGKNMRSIQRERASAEAAAYAQKHNADLQIYSQMAQARLQKGLQEANARYEIDKQAVADDAASKQIQAQAYSDYAKAGGEALGSLANAAQNTELLNKLKALTGRTGGVVGRKFRQGGVNSRVSPSKLIEIQKGEVVYNPNTGAVVTAKDLANHKGIPERTHEQKGYDPQQRRKVSGIQIPKPDKGTVIYGALREPATGVKYQDLAQKLAKDYKKSSKVAQNLNLDALSRRTGLLNAQNSLKRLGVLAESQEALRALKSPKKGL
jgi:hypothetical protein